MRSIGWISIWTASICPDGATVLSKVVTGFFPDPTSVEFRA
jgi:hypothetical protein